MVVEKIVTGYLEENCYVLKDVINKKCLVIDPGDDFSNIKEKICDYKVLKVLLTHDHFDHVGALREIMDNYKVGVLKKSNSSDREYEINNFNFKIISTPGHTRDSITFYFYNDKIMFTGDFLFHGTIGRTDLPTGSQKDMFNSLAKIKEYPEETIIYPGHGDVSTLGEEFRNNIYFVNL